MHFLVECSSLSYIRQGFIQSLKDTLITKNAETCVMEIITDPKKSSSATVSKTFKINLEGQNYVHFYVILSRNVKIFGIMTSL